MDLPGLYIRPSSEEWERYLIGMYLGIRLCTAIEQPYLTIGIATCQVLGLTRELGNLRPDHHSTISEYETQPKSCLK